MLFVHRKSGIVRFALLLILLSGMKGIMPVQAANATQQTAFAQTQVETALLVKDINPGAPSSGYSSFENLGGILYFGATDGTLGEELWKSDGTPEGTVLVKDIKPGASGSLLRYFKNVNGILYFSADDGVHGHELWKSDGTAEGTVLVKDINSSTSSSISNLSPHSLTNVNGILYFAVSDSTNGIELWKSDGTEEGTVLVRDINPGASSSNPSNLVDVNGTLFFTATVGSYDAELWKSDGTPDGTVMVKDIFPGSVGSEPYNLTNVNGTLIFVAAGDLNGYNDDELWKSDGTSAGTVLVKDIWPGVNPSYPDAFETVNGILYFEASDGVHGNELWKSDGTSAGTVMVKDIWTGDRGWGSEITHVGNTVYFGAQDGLSYSLWKSDGTSAGTVKVASPGPGEITNLNGLVYYSANDGISGVELWRSDGTASGTEFVRDINPVGDSWPDDFIDVNGTLYFSANDDVHGYELWKIGWGDPPPPTSTPSITPSPIFTLTPTATPRTLVISGNVGVEAVTLSYFDGVDKTVVSDSNGNYSITIIANSWSGTVQPSKPGYRFWPVTRSYTNIVSSMSDMDYTAERLFTISGNAGIAGVTISYTDGTAKYVTTGDNGNYSLQIPETWTGIVAPYKYHYRLTPENISFNNVQADQPNQDFAGQRVVFISGSTGVSGVSLSYTDGTPKTVTSVSNGYYWIEVSENWSGAIVPSKTGYVFSPSSNTYSDLVTDHLSDNYAATPIVTNVNDSGEGSLRQAISNAIAGTTIRFDPSLAGQTITLASQLEISKNLTIDGSGLDPRVAVSGNQAVRLFNIGFNDTVALKSLILKDGRMSGTSYTMFGGAIYTNGSARLTLTDVVLTGNRAHQAGAIYISPNARVTIQNSELTSNSSDSIGGAIYAQSQGNLTLLDSLLQNNSATDAGGAVYLAAAGSRLLENNTFSGNTAGSAGAIMVDQTSNSNVTLRNNLFDQNVSTSSVGSGGALRIDISSIPAILNAENNTFYANRAANVGGAVSSEGESHFTNNTFSNNQADKAGGAAGASLYLSSGFGTYLYNNILANNTGGGECASFGSNYTAGANNIVEDGSGPCASLPGTITSEPMLSPLGDNGGSTRTMPLLPESPAINAGDNANCPVTDQRGVSRPQGNSCDIGAFEYIPLPTATASPTQTSTNTPTLTPTPSNTPTPSSTPILSCDAVNHGPLTLSGNTMSLSITNPTDIPLAVQDVFAVWDHDRGHSIGNDKSLILQDVSLNGVSFWSGNDYGPSLTVTPLDLFIPPGESTIVFTFHQSYDRSDQSEEILINLATNGCQSYPIHAVYEPPTATPTPTHTFTPTVTPPYSYSPLYLSLTGSQTIGGVASADEDILRFDGQNWSLLFDGSDVGVGSPDLFAFSILDADTILMSFSANVTVNGITATPQDVLRFDATSLGSTTSGTWSLYFDGSDVSFADATNEKIDSLSLLPDGRLLISATGNPSVPGATTARDEDVLAFTPTSLGNATSGTWSMYFDGSDVGLSEISGEDIDALDVVGNNIYLSTQDVFSVNRIAGEDDDVFVCAATSIGDVTACNYSPSLYFDGSTWGLTANDVDAFNFLAQGSIPTAVPTHTATPTQTASQTSTQTPTATGTSGPSPTHTSTATHTPTPTSGSGSTMTFAPYADARVVQTSPTTNYGTATTLQSDGDSGAAQTSFISFNVGGLIGPIQNARLRVFCTTNGTVNGPAVYLANASWAEYGVGGIHWNNQPGLASGAFDNKGSIAANSWVEYDVTTLITTNGTYSFALVADSSDGIVFSSREGTTSPQLVVTLGEGGATATHTATPTFTDMPGATNTPTQTPTLTHTPTATGSLTASPTPTNASAVSIFSFASLADTYVDANNPANNYGALPTLRVDASPVIRSYLRFNVQGLNGTVTRATLRIYANSASSQGCTANGVSDNTWSESTLTYNNAPPLGSALGSSGSFGASAWISIDVTAYITGNGTYNLALTTPGNTAISFASREAGDNAPQLVVETAP